MFVGMQFPTVYVYPKSLDPFYVVSLSFTENKSRIQGHTNVQEVVSDFI